MLPCPCVMSGPSGGQTVGIAQTLTLLFVLHLLVCACVRSGGRAATLRAAGAKLWKNISIGGIGLCFVVGAYEYKVHMDHHHGPKFEYENNAFAHTKIRNKAFPWSCPDCGLFQSDW